MSLETPAPRRSRSSSAAAIAAPADRRFRRPDVRPGRRRRVGQAIWLVARWTMPVLAILAGGAWGTLRLLHSDYMKVSRVLVQGNVRLSAGEVEALVEGIHNENILRVDLEAYRRRVLDSPWVADVAMARVLPSTVTLQVSERVPLAIARLGQELYLVDTTGAIIDEFGPQYRQFDLPVIDGLVRSSRTAPDESRVRLVRALLASLGDQPALRRSVSQIDVASAHDIVVMFEDDPTWLHLGDTNFVSRLRTYLELAPTLRDRFADMDYVDLRFDERVFVRPHRGTARVVKTTQER